MINPRWQKVLRDLWNNRGRTFLVVLAIAVGVFSFGGVFITRTVLLTSMDQQYRASNPASINLTLNQFDQSLISWVKNQPQVADARGIAIQSVKLVKPNKTEVINLIALDDYQSNQIGKLIPQSGSWPPQRGEIVIERGSLSLVNADLGDNLTLKLPGDRIRTLKFRGTVFDISAIPARFFPQITSYVSFSTLASLGLPQAFNQINIVTAPSLTTLSQIDAFAESLKNSLEDRGFEVLSVESRKPDEHWGKGPTNAFVAILSAIGVTTLAMTGFLVINTISSVLAQQKRQIGVMKAVGANTRQVSLLYFVTVLFFGLLALLLALPLSLLLAYLNLKIVTDFLNVDLVNFHLPPSVFLLMLTASLIVPLLSALVPVLRGANTPVNQAISQYTAVKSRAGLIDRLLINFKSPSRSLILSLRNTFRDRRRLFLTLSTLTLAGTLFISVINLRSSFIVELDKAVTRDSFNIKIILNKQYSSPALKKKAFKLPAVIFVDTEINYPAQIQKGNQTKSPTFTLKGIEPASPLFNPEILVGRWLTSQDSQSLVITKELQNLQPDLIVGKVISLDLKNKLSRWEIVGIVNLTGEGNNLAYANSSYLASLTGDYQKVSVLNLQITSNNADFELATAKQLENDFDRAGIKVGNILTMSALRESNISMFNFLIGFLLSMAVLVALVGSLSLAGTMSLNILERTREIGVIRSIGASNFILGRIILTEGIIIGVFSWLVALPLTIPATFIFTYGVGVAFSGSALPFSYSFTGVVIWLFIVCLISAFGSLLPARRAVATSVREALAYE